MNRQLQRVILCLLLACNLCASPAGKKTQLLDHFLTLEDLRESVNQFFSDALFDEKLEMKRKGNSCIGIYERYRNQSRQSIEAALRELSDRFPYCVLLRQYGKETVLTFLFQFPVTKGKGQLLDSTDIYFSFDDTGKLVHVGKGGGTMRRASPSEEQQMAHKG